MLSRRAGIGYKVGMVLFSGLPPFLATLPVGVTGSKLAPAFVVMVVPLAAALTYPRRRHDAELSSIDDAELAGRGRERAGSGPGLAERSRRRSVTNRKESTVDSQSRAWMDKNELAELVAVLSSAVDRADWERIVSCYAEQSYDDHGQFKGSGREFADWVCAAGAEPRHLPNWHHQLGQSIFVVDGDEAWGETFWMFHWVEGETVRQGFGRYIDYFQRIDRIWKVKYRRVVPDRSAAPELHHLYPAGSRDRGDPLYDRLRWPPEL